MTPFFKAQQLRLLSVCLFAAVVAIMASPVSVFDVEPTSFLQTETGIGLNCSSLTVNAGPNRETKVSLGDAAKKFELVMDGSSGAFEVRHMNQRSFVANSDGTVDILGSLTSKGAMRIDGPVTFQGVPQWRIAAVEDFSEGANGWSNDTTSTCGHPKKHMLGGYPFFAGGEVSKMYYNLPAPHSHVRVRANYHMIDEWGGEFAYMNLNHRKVWTDSHDQAAVKAGFNFCGNAAPESRFAIPIDVILPHECSSSADCTLHVTFGSTLKGDATKQSFGVSDVMVFVK